jgi:uracil-DNA glycosylase family 4
VFTGDRSGDWLYRALFRAGFANQPSSDHLNDGLRLADAYVTAAVRCAPPANKPTANERATCLPYLERELSLFDRLRVIVALGRLAHDTVAGLFGASPRPRFAHGAESSLPGTDVTLISSFHPSQQNTFTGKLTQPAFDAVFARARALVGPSVRT